MFGIFKKKTLEEKVERVKTYAQKHKLSGNDANIVYMVVALETFRWEDAAKHFFENSLRERIRVLVND